MTEKERGNSLLALKAGIWYVLGNFIGKAITFITTPIFARMMTPYDYGEFSNFASWVVMLTFVVGVEVHSSLSRAYYDFKQNYDEYISSVTILCSIITVATYVLFLIFGNFVFEIVSIPKQYVHLLFFFLYFSLCRLIYYARERTLYRYHSVALITFLSLFIPTVISITLVYFMPESNHLSARLYGYYLPSALIGLFCFVSLLKSSRVFKWQYCRYALVLSLPLLIHYLTTYLLTSTNIVITKNILGAEITAVVSIAHSATHILTVFFQATSGALTTWLMDNLELGDRLKIRKGILLYVLLLAVLVVASILLTPEIIHILGGKRYLASVSILPGLVFATFIQSVTSVFIIILTYDKNVFKTAVYTAVFALISVTAKVLLIHDYGLMVLVYVNIAVFGSLFLINYILVKNAGYANVLPFKNIVFIILVVGIITVTNFNLYALQNIRYALLGILVLFLALMSLKSKEYFMAFIRNIRKK